MKDLASYALHLADTRLILGQRLGEWCGHAFVLEQDIALSNIGLDLLGQCRSYYQYAAELLGADKTEDQLAFLRSEREYQNLLLVEQPNGDFAQTVARQFLFDAYHVPLCEALLNSTDERLKAIAGKAVKEARYHLTWSSEWVIRLGDGTPESHARMQRALDGMWMWCAEMFMPAAYEKALGLDPSALKEPWRKTVTAVVTEATLQLPSDKTEQCGGKQGLHSEHLGFILSEMQFMQRTYPGLTW